MEKQKAEMGCRLSGLSRASIPAFGWVLYEVGSHLPFSSRLAQDEACSEWVRYCIDPVKKSGGFDGEDAAEFAGEQGGEVFAGGLVGDGGAGFQQLGGLGSFTRFIGGGRDDDADGIVGVHCI